MIYDRPEKIYTGTILPGEKCFFCEKEFYKKAKNEKYNEATFYDKKSEMLNKNINHAAIKITFRGANIYICKECAIKALHELDKDLVIQTKEEAQALSDMINKLESEEIAEDKKKGKTKNGKQS